MKIKSGVLEFTKPEQAQMETALRHARADLSYGWDGSYGGHDTDNKAEERRAAKERAAGERGVELIQWIVDNFKKK